MTTLLHRGISKKTDTWVYGHYFVGPLYLGMLEKENKELKTEGFFLFDKAKNEKIHCISEEGVVHEVHERTVSMCSGRKDKNGKMIFSDDVLKVNVRGEYIKEYVMFANGMFVTAGLGRLRDGSLSVTSLEYNYKPEIIGNLHENRIFVEYFSKSVAEEGRRI